MDAANSAEGFVHFTHCSNALMALLLIGPGVIFGFTAAMTLGLFVGCYSSIYMANPILVWLGVGPHRFVPQQTEADKAEEKLKESL